MAALTEWTYEALSKLRHSNGAPMVKIFGKHARPNHRQVGSQLVGWLAGTSGLPMPANAACLCVCGP